MIYILFDIVLNTYLRTNTYLFILNIRNKSLINIVITSLFLSLFIFDSIYISIILITLFFIDKKININRLIKDIIYLVIFMIVVSLIYNEVNYINILLINIPIYILCYILTSENIEFTRMIKYGKYRRNNK